MPFKKANDIEIYYEIHGEGIPIVLIGGFRTNVQFWKDYIKPLSKDYQVILFDNRGAGQSEAPEIPYSIEMMAEDTVALLEELHIPSAHFVGHSMGGAIVMQLCIEHRDKVRKAVIAGSCAKLPETGKLQILSSRKLFDSGVSPEILIESRLPWIYSNAFLSDPENIKRVIHERLYTPYPQSPAGYYGQIDALISMDLREDLKKIEAKTLIIAGEEDIFFPHAHHFLMKQIPNAKLAMIKHQGHGFILEKPEECIQLIKEFFH